MLYVCIFWCLSLNSITLDWRYQICWIRIHSLSFEIFVARFVYSGNAVPMKLLLVTYSSRDHDASNVLRIQHLINFENLFIREYNLPHMDIPIWIPTEENHTTSKWSVISRKSQQILKSNFIQMNIRFTPSNNIIPFLEIQTNQAVEPII